MGTTLHAQAGILGAPSLQKLCGSIVGSIVHRDDFELLERLVQKASQGLIEGCSCVKDG